MPFPMLAWTVALASAAVAPGVDAAPATHVVKIARMAYGPLPKTIRAGDTIEWRNEDVVPHTATAESAGFDATVEPGKSATTIVKTRGRFEVHCSYHPAMTAVLVVE
jgi:plastocyanin